MPQVSVGPQFFESELRVYSNWRIAFARELLQNAIDANPASIDVWVEVIDDQVVVKFTDTGTGMDRDVLVDVFFKLGETTKTGAGTIGGYGRARMITCFAQQRYTIHTGDLLVEGRGGDYEISQAVYRRTGTRFVIHTADTDPDLLARAFRVLLYTCQMPVPVTVNGQQIGGLQTPDRARRVFRDEDDKLWAKVYTPDTSRSYGGQLLLRVSGLTMTSMTLSSTDKDVIVELEPSRAREVLAASRDRLAEPFSAQLDRFVHDLTRNRRRALPKADRPLRVHVSGGGFELASSKTPDEDRADTCEQQPSEPTPAKVEALTPSAPSGLREAAFVRQQADGPQRSLFTGETEDRMALGFDVFMLSDSSDSRVRALARSWNPASWDASRGRLRRALLLAWKQAVDISVELLCERLGDYEVAYTVGWTFDSEAEALHRQVSRGHVLALNPVNDAGQTAFKLTDRGDLRRMLALALHETVHVAIDGHDEDFSSLLTDLIGRVDQADAVRRVRETSKLA